MPNKSTHQMMTDMGFRRDGYGDYEFEGDPSNIPTVTAGPPEGMDAWIAKQERTCVECGAYIEDDHLEDAQETEEGMYHRPCWEFDHLTCIKCKRDQPRAAFNLEEDICVQCEHKDEQLSQRYWREQ